MSATDAAPPGVDLAAVSRYLGRQGLRAELVSGGRSNLTYRIWNDEGEWVLRRPPLGHVLPTAHDMGREYRVITALADTGVPVPRTIAFCNDVDVIGAPFYVMEMVHGIIVGDDGLPDGYASSAEDKRRMAAALVDTLATLHGVDWRAAGLEGFGRPEGYLERQVRRWAKQWEGNKTRELPAVDELRRQLERHLPGESDSTIVHGDYRLGNAIFDAADPGRILAVLDWEMSTLGDPLADLGWLLVYWNDPDAVPDPSRVDLPSGFPPESFVVERYAATSARAVDDLAFYAALGFYKLAVIAAGIHARYLKGQTVGEGFETVGARPPLLAEEALRALPS